MELATGIEPAPPAWEAEFSILYFQQSQNRSRKMYVHALHAVHALLTVLRETALPLALHRTQLSGLVIAPFVTT